MVSSNLPKSQPNFRQISAIWTCPSAHTSWGNVVWEFDIFFYILVKVTNLMQSICNEKKIFATTAVKRIPGQYGLITIVLGWLRIASSTNWDEFLDLERQPNLSLSNLLTSFIVGPLFFCLLYLMNVPQDECSYTTTKKE